MNEKLELQHREEIEKLLPVRDLSDSAQEQFLRLADIATIPAGSRLFDDEQERYSHALIFLLDGTLERLNHLGESNLLTAEDFHGLPINYYEQPQQEFIASSRLTVLTINPNVWERLSSLGQYRHLPLDAAHITPILGSAIFSRIPVAHLSQLFNQFRAMFVKRGDQVVTQNMPGDYLYLIKDGSAQATYRAKDLPEPVVVAEYQAGDCFGEEAFQENVRRQTSVVMLETGALLKLSRKDYESLIVESPEGGVSVEHVVSEMKDGAFLVDLRSEAEFEQLHVQGSRSLPYTRLEAELISLPSDVNSALIFICHSGELGASAVAQLAKHGRTASYLKDGILSLPDDVLVRALSSLETRSQSSEHTGTNIDSESANLRAEENPVDEQINEITQQIDDVGSRIQHLKREIFSETQEAQAWLSSDRLIEASPSKDDGLLAAVSKRIEAIENKKTLSKPDQQSGEARSRADLSELRQQLENAQHQLLEEHDKSNAAGEASGKELSLQRVSEELEHIKVKLKEQEHYELQRHQQFENQLAAERKKMRDQLARFSLGSQPAQSTGLEVEKVKMIVAQEMRHVVDKFKAMQAQQRLHQQRKIAQVRKQLQQQAALVIAKARKANAEKEQALQALREARQQLEVLRRQRTQGDSVSPDTDQQGEEVPLLVDIQSMGEKIDQAKRQLRVAESTMSVAKVENQRNRQRMEKVRQTEAEFKHELIDWLQKNPQLTSKHEGLSAEQQLKLARIKKLAQEALDEAINGPRRPRGGDDADDHAFNQVK